jgi:uncharacterized protein
MAIMPVMLPGKTIMTQAIHQTHSPSCQRAALLCAVALSVLPISSFAGSTSTTATQATQSRLAADAEQAAAQGRYAEAATQFETLAAQATGATRDHALLKAARSYQLIGNDGKVDTLLPMVSKTLSVNDSALRVLIVAASQLRTSQPVAALNALDEIPLPLPDNLAGDILGVRAQAQFALGRVALALNTAIDRERTLKSEADLTQNRQMIWSALRQAAAAGRDLTPPAGASRIAAGWLELAKLMNSETRDPFAFNRSIADWRSRYAGHPGFNYLPVTMPLPVARSNTVALLLPLSGKQQAAAQAVRDGFMAAALQAGQSHPAIQIYDTDSLTAVTAYQRALEGGADMVVGPLLKEDVDALVQSNRIGVVTLALNLSSEPKSTSALLFQFALDPETEAQQVARRAHSDGLSKAIALVPNNEWGQRMQKAFAAELDSQGDQLVESRYYDPNARDYVNFIKQVFASKKPPQAKALEETLGKRQIADTRDDYDYVFIAAQPAQAKQLRPALRFVLPDKSAPVYTTSDSYDAESGGTSDLNDTRIADMPWVIDRDSNSPLLHDNLGKLWGNNFKSRSRLYAFGVDAFRISEWLRSRQASLGSTLNGVTGLLALDSSGHVQRQLDWARIVNGKPQLLPEVVQ